MNGIVVQQANCAAHNDSFVFSAGEYVVKKVRAAFSGPKTAENKDGFTTLEDEKPDQQLDQSSPDKYHKLPSNERQTSVDNGFGTEAKERLPNGTRYTAFNNEYPKNNAL